MRPRRLLRSESFRLAALFAGLFLALTGVLIGSVLWLVDRTQLAGLQSANDADIAAVGNGFRDEGRDEAMEVVRQLLGPQRDGDAWPAASYMLLADDAGGKLAGNLPRFAPRTGTLKLPLQGALSRADLPADFVLGRGAYIAPGLYLFVGRSTQQIRQTRNSILEAFVWIAAGALVLACCGGILFGTRFLRRVDSITRTCEAIVDGRFQERIPASGGGNEWDRLAQAINAMLDRIALLLDNLRQVSSDVAHDLRTPLTRLRSRLEETRLKSLTAADYDAAVAQAIQDTDELLALFAALLRISQIESGTRAAGMSRLSLSELLERVYQLYKPVAEDQRHELSDEIASDVTVLGDSELLVQLFSNVVENAIRHTPAGTGIRIGLAITTDGACAYVTDSGPGIPATEHDKVLRRFYQLSSGRSNGGHGLGLALVAAIAGLHKATLTLTGEQPGLRVSIVFRR